MEIVDVLDNLETYVNAPGGIPELRQLVLGLAVQGRLVPQIPTEPSVGDGLDEVRSEKGPTLATSIRGGDATPRVPTAGEHPTALPEGWHWARVDDTGDYVNGLAFKSEDWRPTGIPIIRIQNLTNPSTAFNYAEGPFPSDRMVNDGDILVSWSATLDAFLWCRGPAVVNQHIFKAIPDKRVIRPSFLLHLLRYCIRALAGSDAAHGLAMQHINRGPFLSFVVGLPPLDEQARIVEALERLNRLFDQLELQQQTRAALASKARRSALASLIVPSGGDDLQAAWKRVDGHWPSFLDGEEGIDDVRQVTLELAVRGRLARQNPSEEPAKGLLSKTRRAPASTPFEVPSGWTWATFGEVAESRLGKMLDKAKNTGQLRPYLRNANVQWFRFDLEDVLELRLEDDDLEAHVVHSGDLLICEGGKPGRSAVCDSTVDGMVFQKALHRVRPHPGISSVYLAYVLRCYATNGFLANFFTGATIKHLTGRSLSGVPVPLPPAAEQTRIVQTIVETLALCDGMQRRVVEAQALAVPLVSATVQRFQAT